MKANLWLDRFQESKNGVLLRFKYEFSFSLVQRSQIVEMNYILGVPNNWSFETHPNQPLFEDWSKWISTFIALGNYTPIAFTGFRL